MKAISYSTMSPYKYPFHILRHPFDGYQEMKFNNKGSLAFAFGVLIAWFFSNIYYKLGTSFEFNSFRVDKFNIFFVLLSTVVIFVLGIIANWSFCTLMDGKGRFKDIFIYCAYALIPIVVGSFLTTFLSTFIAVGEEVFLKYIMSISYIWSAVLGFVALKELHDYSVKKTVVSIVLTIIGILIILFLSLLVYSLVQQILSFVVQVYNEVMFKFFN